MTKKIAQDIDERQRVRDEITKKIIRKGMPSRFLPILHYQMRNNFPEKVLDDLGVMLIDKGLKIQNEFSTVKDRWYASRENFQYATTGYPVTNVNAYLNKDLYYILVRSDGTNQNITLKPQEVISVELKVENPAEIPTMFMGLMGGYPIYDEIREGLFEFSEQYPFIEDKQYIDFISNYKEIDRWLVAK